MRRRHIVICFGAGAAQLASRRGRTHHDIHCRKLLWTGDLLVWRALAARPVPHTSKGARGVPSQPFERGTVGNADPSHGGCNHALSDGLTPPLVFLARPQEATLSLPAERPPAAHPKVRPDKGSTGPPSLILPCIRRHPVLSSLLSFLNATNKTKVNQRFSNESHLLSQNERRASLASLPIVLLDPSDQKPPSTPVFASDCPVSDSAHHQGRVALSHIGNTC